MYVYTVCACACLHVQSVSKYKRGGVCVNGKKTAHRAPTPITRSHSNGRRVRPAGGGGWGATCVPKIAATGPPKAVKASSAEPGFPEALAPHPVPALQPLGPSSSCREEPTSLGLIFHPSCQLAFISSPMPTPGGSFCGGPGSLRPSRRVSLKTLGCPRSIRTSGPPGPLPRVALTLCPFSPGSPARPSKPRSPCEEDRGQLGDQAAHRDGRPASRHSPGSVCAPWAPGPHPEWHRPPPLLPWGHLPASPHRQQQRGRRRGGVSPSHPSCSPLN